jgi:hypothetical protein
MTVDTQIVVFGTRHLESDGPLYLGQSPVYTEHRRGQHLRTYSTGRLEEALRLGLRVYVVSIRPAFGPQDEWWRRALPAERVRSTPGIFQIRSGREILPAVFRPWVELYEELGLPWPQAGFSNIDEPARHLHENLGLVDPESLIGFRVLN